MTEGFARRAEHFDWKPWKSDILRRPVLAGKLCHELVNLLWCDLFSVEWATGVVSPKHPGIDALEVEKVLCLAWKGDDPRLRIVILQADGADALSSGDLRSLFMLPNFLLI